MGLVSVTFLLGGENQKKNLKKATGLENPLNFKRKTNEIPSYDQASEMTKPNKKKNNIIIYKPRVFHGPKVIARSVVESIPPGTMFKAKLISGASDGFVKAIINVSQGDSSEQLLPPGTVFIGNGVTKDFRLYVSFNKIVLPDGNVKKIEAVAADLSDKVPGLKGKKVGHYTKKLAASSGLSFIAGLSSSLKKKRVEGGVEVHDSSLKNAALQGSSEAAIALSKELLAKAKEEKVRIEKKAGEKLYILFK